MTQVNMFIHFRLPDVVLYSLSPDDGHNDA